MNVIESQQVLEWMAMGEARGEAEAMVRGEIKFLLRALASRFPPGAPSDLETAIRAATNEEQVLNWFDLAIKAKSLQEFRQAAGL